MKTRWTTHLWNGAIWLALSPCHMTMTCKINKLEKPGGPLSIFHTLFGRYAAFYGHFWADTVTSEWSTHISSSDLLQIFFLVRGKSFFWISHDNWLLLLQYLKCRSIEVHSNSLTLTFSFTREPSSDGFHPCKSINKKKKENWNPTICHLLKLSASPTVLLNLSKA